MRTDFLASDQDSIFNSKAYDFGTGDVHMWECGSKGYGSPAKYCCESAGEKTRCCSTSIVVFELGAAATGNPSSMALSWLHKSSSSTTKPTSSILAEPCSSGAISPTLSATLRQVMATTPTAAVTQKNSTTGQKIVFGVGIPLITVTVICLAYLVWYKRHSEARLKRVEKQLVAEQQGRLQENSPYPSGGPHEMLVHERPAMLAVPRDHLHELPPLEHS